jgi:hypothetical protein
MTDSLSEAWLALHKLQSCSRAADVVPTWTLPGPALGPRAALARPSAWRPCGGGLLRRVPVQRLFTARV